MTSYKFAYPKLESVQVKEEVRRLEADLFKHASSEVSPLISSNKTAKAMMANYYQRKTMVENTTEY